MCYKDPCVKCLDCGECVVACFDKLNEGSNGGEWLSNYSITYNAAHLPPNTTVSIDPPIPSVLVKNTPPEMSDDDAFDLMDSIKKEMYDTRGTD